jgi:hypothetical protein
MPAYHTGQYFMAAERKFIWFRDAERWEMLSGEGQKSELAPQPVSDK